VIVKLDMTIARRVLLATLTIAAALFGSAAVAQADSPFSPTEWNDISPFSPTEWNDISPFSPNEWNDISPFSGHDFDDIS